MTSKKVSISHFDLAAKHFDEKYKDVRSRYFRKLQIDPVINSLQKNAEIILDLGTATGRIPLHLIKKFHKATIVGIDFSNEMINKAVETRQENNIHYLLMRAENLGFKKHTFDAVTSVSAFVYNSDWNSYLKEVYNVLKPGGNLIITCRNSEALYESFTVPLRNKKKKETIHISHSIREIYYLLSQNGFTLKDYYGTFFISPNLLWRYLRFFYFKIIKRVFLEVIIFLNIFLGKFDYFKDKGGEFIILATRN